ncbi:helix-hairpin-helix domain-containing protein [Bacillus sp. CLL-7-23]|uniref:Helix-hairpin-helix domain-containing protein n=1 Tax=Bacillus changyiensis TaxID=3004103 RepID=A0ABT4X226_9BACI|nr:helix-hairpin-helix domain-containing protein [Bacillus changyiensis]MDA7026142.1 helix-hairpin-helix domain-containing protein [Bacillus changyiensis]
MKLPLEYNERKNLRLAKVKQIKIPEIEIDRLAQFLDSSLKRAKYIKALAEFQMIPSIGPKIAQSVIDLGYYSLADMKDQTGAELINRLEKQKGYWHDPCAEDALRCIVHHANHPDSNKNWWHFTSERKKFRVQYGYPQDRPIKPWHERKH